MNLYPSEDGNGIPSKQPSTFGRNTGMNDDEWYHELRARYKMAMSIQAKKKEIITLGNHLQILNQILQP